MDVIRVNNFRKSFKGRAVHQGVSFSVKKGECLGLIGGSGAGKSVILRSLIGLEKPDSGEIFIGNDEISRWDEKHLVEIRKKVAYVFQNGALFDSMTVFDNLAYALREHTQLSEQDIDRHVHELLGEFGLTGHDEVFPSQLSGGMQKRVGLARSIILGPEVVLYDEPTAGLDPFNTCKIQEMILRLKSKGVSSIFVTHDMPSAKAVCDRMALLLDGKVAATVDVADMDKEPNSLIEKFVRGQQI